MNGHMLLISVDPLLHALAEKACGELTGAAVSLHAAASLRAAKEVCRARPVQLIVADQHLPDGPGLSLCTWAKETGLQAHLILLADDLSPSDLRRAFALGVFRLLPRQASLEEMTEALRAAARDERERRLSYYQRTHEALVKWNREQIGAKKLDVLLTSGLNLDEIFHDGILPEKEPLHLLRLKITEWQGSESWGRHALQMAVGNLCWQALAVRWQVGPIVPMGRHTFAVFCWGGEHGQMEADADGLYALCQEKLRCAVSLKYQGPFEAREAPLKWRLLTSDDLNGEYAEMLTGRQPVPPEIRLWSDMLQSKHPRQLINHMHKYVASRWTGMPPTQDEMQQLYYQFLQAVDIATGEKNIWSKVLLDSGKYEKYTRGARSLEGFFAFVVMTVQEFTDMQSAGEIPLVERINLYLEDHLEEEIQCRDLSVVFKMSPDYLNRQFKQQTGRTLKEYISTYKMENARRLLSISHLPISVVASKVGYSNFSHFSAAFKKIYGVTPLEIRKQENE